jgi:hypothetical protein
MSTGPRKLARARARELTCTGTRSLARDLADDLARARELIYDPDPVHAKRLSRAIYRARKLAYYLDPAYEMRLSRRISRGRELAHQLDTDLDLDRSPSCDLARDLTRALVYRLDCAYDLNRTDTRENREREVKGIALPAAKLLAVVARLLPAAARDRYDEEFRSELWCLAQAGAGHLRQVAYALRQLRCVCLTAAALRSPRRRGATP